MKASASGILMVIVGIILAVSPLIVFSGLSVFHLILIAAGILLVALGAKALRAKPSISGMRGGMPLGVTALTVLTLVCSIVFGYVVLLGYVLFALIGSSPYVSGVNWQATAIFLVGGVFELFGFVLSVVVLTGATSRSHWYGLVGFWLIFQAGFVWFFSATGVWRLAIAYGPNSLIVFAYSAPRIILFALPFICGAACVTHLFAAKTKTYFHLNQEKPQTPNST